MNWLVEGGLIISSIMICAGVWFYFSHTMAREKYTNFLAKYPSVVEFAKEVSDSVKKAIVVNSIIIHFHQKSNSHSRDLHACAKICIYFKKDKERGPLKIHVLFHPNYIDGPSGYEVGVAFKDYRGFENRICYEYNDHDKQRLVKNILDQIDIEFAAHADH